MSDQSGKQTSPEMIERDLAIEAACLRIIRRRFPAVSDCDIQNRSHMDIGSGYYLVHFDARPVALVELNGDSRFTLTVI